MRNFRGDYSIGLDIGSASVGWSAVGAEGELLRFKKQPAWGSRLFDSANTAPPLALREGNVAVMFVADGGLTSFRTCFRKRLRGLTLISSLDCANLDW